MEMMVFGLSCCFFCDPAKPGCPQDETIAVGCSSSFIPCIDHLSINARLYDSLELGGISAVDVVWEVKTIQILGVYGVVFRSSALRSWW